jgi:hypothetical protein
MDAITSWPRPALDTRGWNAAHSAPQRLRHDHLYRFKMSRATLTRGFMG